MEQSYRTAGRLHHKNPCPSLSPSRSATDPSPLFLSLLWKRKFLSAAQDRQWRHRRSGHTLFPQSLNRHPLESREITSKIPSPPLVHSILCLWTHRPGVMLVYDHTSTKRTIFVTCLLLSMTNRTSPRLALTTRSPAACSRRKANGSKR